MQDINWDKVKVRCSGIGKIMAESRDNPSITPKQLERLDELEKKDKLTDNQRTEMIELLVKKANLSKISLSDTCIEYLMEVYAWETEGMIPIGKEALDLVQIKKGKLAENDGIKLLSIVRGNIYNKNTERVSNEFLSGEPDVFQGETLMGCEAIDDIKLSWDYPTYLKMGQKPLEKSYISQIRGYGDITGAKVLHISKCLVSAPHEVVEDMKWKLIRRMNVLTEESPEFLKEWEVWYRSMMFDHIPPTQRVNSIKVEPFTPEEKQKIYDRVKYCREWLNNFHQERIKL